MESRVLQQTLLLQNNTQTESLMEKSVKESLVVRSEKGWKLGKCLEKKLVISEIDSKINNKGKNKNTVLKHFSYVCNTSN